MAQRQDYIKKMELKKQARLKEGLLSEKHPNVSGIVLLMTYFNNSENPLLMERTVNVFPSSYAYFLMECMTKTCEEGGYDLTKIIAKTIKQKKKVVRGEMPCKGKIDKAAMDHASIKYEINIKYGRRAK